MQDIMPAVMRRAHPLTEDQSTRRRSSKRTKRKGRRAMKWGARGSRWAELIAAYGMPVLALIVILGYLLFRALGW